MLRRTVPQTASVYVSADVEPQAALRVAATLPHAHLFGHLQTSALHLLSRLPAKPLDDQESDLTVTSSRLAPAVFPPAARRRFWWNEKIAVYAPIGTIPYIRDPPTTNFSVRLSDVREHQNRLSFTALFTDQATDRWSGQDWVVISIDDSSWLLPDNSTVGRRTRPPARSFKGQLQPVSDTKVQEYTYL